MRVAEMIESYYESMEGSELLREYHRRHGTETAGILTVYDDEYAGEVAEYLRPRIEGKIVVEVGAGIGLLACHLATIARRVYAIEVDPNWIHLLSSTRLTYWHVAKSDRLSRDHWRTRSSSPSTRSLASR